MEKNVIWDRDIIDWLLLVFAVFNAIIILMALYRGDLNYTLLFNAFVSGLCFSGWLCSGLINRKNDLIVKSISLAEEAGNGWKKANELLRKRDSEKIELENKISDYEKKLKRKKRK